MELNVYPDTEQNHIIIETGTPVSAIFKLFDDAGNLIIFQEVADNEKIEIRHLHDELYHYKLTAGPKLQTGKLRLRRPV